MNNTENNSEAAFEHADGKTRTGCNPVNFLTSVVDGHTYYAVAAIVHDENGASQETLLIRNDGNMYNLAQFGSYNSPLYHLNPLDKGDAAIDQALYTDILPRPAENGSWPLEDIYAWKSGEAQTPALNKLITDIEDYLKMIVWLPMRRDYRILAFSTVATFCHSVWHSVPLLLVVGERGSGKSQLGSAMAAICYNGTMIGQISPEAAIREIDASQGGFIVFDDLESIAQQSRGGNFGKLAQVIKTSYNKQSASKGVITSTKGGMKPQKLNYFGIKMINNTRGVDDIVGTRMIKIHTQIRTESSAYFPYQARMKMETTIRCMCHRFAFDNLERICRAYEHECAQIVDRADEISAPLLALAQLMGEPEYEELRESLEDSFNGESAKSKEDIFHDIVIKLVSAGYSAIVNHHIDILMKMRGIKVSDKWIVKKLSAISTKTQSLAWLHRTQRIRAFVIRPEKIEEIRKGKQVEEKHPLDFCNTQEVCKSCPYEGICKNSGRKYRIERG